MYSANVKDCENADRWLEAPPPLCINIGFGLRKIQFGTSDFEIFYEKDSSSNILIVSVLWERTWKESNIHMV